MVSIVKNFCLVYLILCTSLSLAQTKEELALSKGLEAIKLMDSGNFDEALKLLNEAKKLDPKNINFPYEIAYAQYAQKNYKGAIKTLGALLKHKDINPQVYQLLGNSYSMNKEREKAIATYEKGLELFPNSGRLYLERGNMELFAEEYIKALGFYEKGIAVDPKFPSNYYWAAKIYMNSSEEVWGMIYGEIFMNLERNSNRTSEISKMLFDTYQSEIQISGDTTMSVSFSKNASIQVTDLSDLENLKLPFGVGAYEPTLLMSLVGVKQIDLESLDAIRTSFLKNYFASGMNDKYPNVLFEYQKKIQELGHLSAYNHWLLMMGDEDAFVNWRAENEDAWMAFVKWYSENGLKLSENSRFHSSMY